MSPSKLKLSELHERDVGVLDIADHLASSTVAYSLAAKPKPFRSLFPVAGNARQKLVLPMR